MLLPHWTMKHPVHVASAHVQPIVAGADVVGELNRIEHADKTRSMHRSLLRLLKHTCYRAHGRQYQQLGLEAVMLHLIVDFDVKADQVAFAIPYLMILHAGIPSTPALELVKEVCDHLRTNPQAC